MSHVALGQAASASRGSTAESEDSSLTELTRTLMSFAGYPIPEDIPVNLESSSPDGPATSPISSGYVSDEADASPSPSPTKSTRSRATSVPPPAPLPSPSSINWAPPYTPPSTPFRSLSPRLPSPTGDIEVGLEVELVEWNEPRTCQAWRGRMKRVKIMEVILEEEEESVEIGSVGVTKVEKKELVSRTKRSKKRQRKRLSSHFRVYRDRNRVSTIQTQEEEVMWAGKRRVEAVLEDVERNEQRKRRRRNQLPRPETSPPSSSSEVHPWSSPEQVEPRKTFGELEREAKALESSERAKDLIWVEDGPMQSGYNEYDHGSEHTGTKSYASEEEEEELEWSLCRWETK
ncbi:uncharacterized protein JCM6883_003263 [Sporobolomyces salmoneus]|uniref:uncharacterized protein n=1 Tax=Sporobolomyces salmoneus TaxID=183962 RepID=UPI00317117A6